MGNYHYRQELYPQTPEAKKYKKINYILIMECVYDLSEDHTHYKGNISQEYFWDLSFASHVENSSMSITYNHTYKLDNHIELSEIKTT